jgi:predicted transcriptional regulator of viral defense system
MHEIGTQLPSQVWLALPRGARTPVRLPTRVQVVHFSGPMLTYGIERFTFMGVPVSITSPARTIVDCFRFRKRIGLDVAMEALSDAFRDRKVTVDEIWRAAEVCRIRTVIGPYLDTLSV